MVSMQASPAMESDVEQAFEKMPAPARSQVLALRDLIYEVAKENSQIGELTETLKWGQPSYLTEMSKSGTTLRLGYTKIKQAPALFVTCHTTLASEFKTFYPDEFGYEGERVLYLLDAIEDNREALKHCIGLALTYKLRKKSK